jgi:uncharacterized protein (TIGR00369 family)
LNKEKLPELTPEREQALRQLFARIHFVQLLGLELESLGPGAAVVSLAIEERHKQKLGVVHGGATASLIDTASAFAVMTLLQEGEKTTTTDLSIQYLRPLTQGRARAQAQVRRAGRRVVALAVDVFDEQGALAATAITTYLRF